MMRVHMTFVTTVGLPLDSVTPPQSKKARLGRLLEGLTRGLHVPDGPAIVSQLSGSTMASHCTVYCSVVAPSSVDHVCAAWG
jgi:hypothetical protein